MYHAVPEGVSRLAQAERRKDSIMGDAAKGIRAFKDGLSDDGKKDGPQDGVSSLPRTDTEKEELKR